MSILKDFDIYLPKYLSPESTKSLFEEIKSFPDNINTRFYSDILSKKLEIFQGDGLRDIYISNISTTEFKKTNVIVLSNSCDISKKNERFSPINMTYCPIIKLEKYKELLKEFDYDKIENHVNTLKKQEFTSIFYLPKNEYLEDDCIAFLDKINNIEVEKLDYDKVCSNKLFSLSQYAFYLFLIKLSIHFTRMLEGIDRDKENL